MKKKYRFIILLSLMASLLGCHQNPLLNEQNTRLMKANFLFDAKNFPIRSCAEYYRGVGSNKALKTECNAWSEKYYQKLMQFKQLPETTTLEDFRDPRFWKRVKNQDLF